MRESVQQGRGHPLSLEDLLPHAEGQVVRHQQAGPLVTVGEDLEQQVAKLSGEIALCKLATCVTSWRS